MTGSSNTIEQGNQTTAVASLAAGKIAEALTKHYFEKTATKLTAEILGVVSGGLASIIVGTIIDFIDPPQETQIVDYAKIDGFITGAVNTSQLGKASSGIYHAGNSLFENYGPLLKKLKSSSDKVTVSDLLNLDSDLLAAYGYMSNDSYLTQLETSLGAIGIPVFMYGVNLQLGIYQEQFKLYSHFNSKLKNSPSTSDLEKQNGAKLDIYEAYANPKTGTIATTTREHIAALSSNWQAAIENRIKQVSVPSYSGGLIHFTVGIKDGEETVFSQTVDAPNSTWSDFVKGNLGETAMNFCQTYYYPKIISSLCEQMGSPDAMADTWSKLIMQPMGSQSSTDIFDKESDNKINQKALIGSITPTGKDYFLMEQGGATELKSGDRIYSVNRAFYFEFDKNGCASVIRRSDKKVFWDAGISNNKDGQLTLTSSGNLEITDSGKKVVWSSNTNGDNYVFLQDNGILQVKKKGVFDENSGSQVQWNTNVGMLTAAFAVDTGFAGTTYIENNPRGQAASKEIGALVFKENKGSNMHSAATIDGLNWVGPFQLPSTMVTDTAPEAFGYNGTVQTLFKGKGNLNLYLNSSNPYINGFGGLVELDSQVTTDTTPAAIRIVDMRLFTGTDLGVVYKGSNNTSIYEFNMHRVDESSGDLSLLQANATNDTPQRVHFNKEVYLIYTGLSSSELCFKVGDAAPEPIPNGVTALGGPAVVVCQEKLYVVYRGTGENKVWYTLYDGTNWTAPQSIAPDILKTDASPALIVLDNQVFVFVKGLKETNIYCAII